MDAIYEASAPYSKPWSTARYSRERSLLRYGDRRVGGIEFSGFRRNVRYFLCERQASHHQRRLNVTPFGPIAPLLFTLALGGDEGLDDHEIARRIREGDRAAFRGFFDRYHGLLYGYLRRRGVDPAAAEDLVQEAFVTIWEKRSDIDPHRSLRSFLFTIGYNRALNHFRDASKFDGVEKLDGRPSAANPSSSAGFVLLREALLAVIQQLPERRRAVFELCFLEELTYRETAKVLDISVKTVENQMTAALKTIRQALDHYRESYRME